MLNSEKPNTRSNDAIARSLTDDPATNPAALGCPVCPHFGTCGGLSVRAGFLDCLELCCGMPARCSRVCRNKPEKFVDQFREIGGFELGNVPRAPSIQINLQCDVVPLIYHGSRRARALENDVFALRLADLVDYRTGSLRFSTHEALCRAFRIAPNAGIILCGIDHDHRIEPWWTLGSKRVPLIRAMKTLGVVLVTTPNFSVILDQPRPDDLHAIKRIGLVFAEFQNCGLVAALHPNGRTQKDFERWGVFIRERNEVSVLAYEFITGPGRKNRQHYHLDWLADLADGAGRDLDIVVRGDPKVIPFLRTKFRKVIYIETTSFMKTIKRRRANRITSSELGWQSAPTEVNESIDSLFTHNFFEQRALLRALYFAESDPLPVAA